MIRLDPAKLNELRARRRAELNRPDWFSRIIRLIIWGTLALLILGFWQCWIAFGQEAPQARARVSPSEFLTQWAIQRPPVSVRAKVGREFWALVVEQAATGMADVELTRYHIRQDPTWREYNPFLPRRPSRPRMYAQGAAMLLVVNYIAYRLEQRGHRRWARVLQILPLAGFTWGIQQNARHGLHSIDEN